jgi:uncharacterized protein YjdB
MLALTASACLDGPSQPLALGELRLALAFAPGEAPAATGALVDSVRVKIERRSPAAALVDTTMPYESGATLAWVLDLESDPESLLVSMRLTGGTDTLYAGDTLVAANMATGDGEPIHNVNMRLIGPVTTPIFSIVVAPATATLSAAGTTQSFTAQARDAANQPIAGVSFSWTSQTPSVAAIDEVSGIATAASEGSTTIVATAGGVSGTAELTVDFSAPAVARIVVRPATATLTAIGATQQFSAEARDAGGAIISGVAFSWTSSNDAAATVDMASGLATARGAGVSTITATAGGVSGTATLIVSPATGTIRRIEVLPAAATLSALGATQQFTAVARDVNDQPIPGVIFTWASGDTTIASISAATGLATAVGNGAASISATADGITAFATLTVQQVPVQVVVSPATATITSIGGTQLFTAQALDANDNPVSGASFTWSSSDPTVAAIDPSTGVATAVADGSTTITASSGALSGTASLDVAISTVTIAQITVTPATATLTSLGDQQQFSAVARDANGNVLSGATITWSSSNVGTASIDPITGIATALGNGTATITATSGSAAGSAELLVEQVAASVTVTPATAALNSIGDTQQFTAVVRDANGNIVSAAPLAWSSSNLSTTTIDAATGLATARDNGSTTITATSGSAAGSAELLVEQVAASVTVTPATATLNSIGDTQQFTAVVRDANGNVVTAAPLAWSSSDLSTATIDAATGLATARDNGSTTIIARSGSATGSAELLVQQVTASITVTPASVTLTALGDTVRFSAVAVDARGHALSSAVFAWSSSDPTRVTIDAASGLATAIDDGPVTITALFQGVTGTASLNVILRR